MEPRRHRLGDGRVRPGVLMTDRAEARRIALSLPEAVEDGSTFRVGGRLFAWTYQERVAGERARVERPDVLVVRVAHESEKHALIASEPETFFTTAHYDGYAAVLVRLPAIGADELAELLTDAWRTRAPRRLVARYDQTPGRIGGAPG